MALSSETFFITTLKLGRACLFLGALGLFLHLYLTIIFGTMPSIQMAWAQIILASFCLLICGAVTLLIRQEKAYQDKHTTC